MPNQAGVNLARKANVLREGWRRALDNELDAYGHINRREKRIIDKILKAEVRHQLHRRMGWI